MKKQKIIFACGGSGGHTYPLMAVAKEFLKDTDKWSCAFVSSYGSVEEKIVPREGLRLILVPSGKLKGQNPVRLILSLFRIVASLLYSFVLVFKERPSFVFSAGGYAGAPFLVAAALSGIKCGILEQNREPGLANRWMARFCKIVFLNFPATQKSFKTKHCLVVGHPYRKELVEARWPENESAARWSAEPFHIFVFGGSQGAVGINRLVVAALPELKNLNIFIHHQTGPQDFSTVEGAYARADFSTAKIEAYVYDMAQAYKQAHLVICRAGASSLAELAALGKAALLIPLVSKDKHQEANAAEMADVGAAICYLQHNLDGHKLAALIKDYYNDRQKLQTYAKQIRQFDHSDSTSKIFQHIEELIHA